MISKIKHHLSGSTHLIPIVSTSLCHLHSHLLLIVWISLSIGLYLYTYLSVHFLTSVLFPFMTLKGTSLLVYRAFSLNASVLFTHYPLFSPCSADERFDATFHTNVLVNASGSCQYIPPGETFTYYISLITLFHHLRLITVPTVFFYYYSPRYLKVVDFVGVKFKVFRHQGFI